MVAFRQKRISIDARRAHGLEETPLTFHETFDLPDGAYAAKVLVYVDGTGARGFARSDFVIDP